ncbi:hypothetical protein DXC08_06875 [Clostridium sp. OM07-9AC]|nr:hypothetical protein DXC08_06875 [Clostridium sp. OM07-9AC]
MRAYGRFMKNTAALLLLLALLSLLLPFCRFQAKGQDMTLSGVEVLTAGGKAGYTYLQQGGVPDDFVLKAPFTWGDVKEGIHYADQTGNSNLLVAAGVAVCLPVILCFLAMCMLFLAEGKKTMVLPTIFTAAVTAELLVVLAGFTAIHPFLLAGVYLFALFHIMALILILFGWTLGGYREPKQKKRGKDGADREKNEDRDRKKSRDHSRRNKKSKRKKKRRSSKDSKKKDDKKDKSSEKNSKKNRKKNEDQDEKNSQDQKQREQENSRKGIQAAGSVGEGTGIYSGLSWNLTEGKSSAVTIGTTPEAMRGIETGSMKAAGQIADHNCQIIYHAGDGAILWQVMRQRISSYGRVAEY